MIRHIFDQDWTFYLQAETDPEFRQFLMAGHAVIGIVQ